jgi:hypothetical protein
MPAELPAPNKLRQLPDNHRRVVAALLASLSRHFTDLAISGTIRVSGEAVQRLADLTRSLEFAPPAGHREALRQALLVQLDEIEPKRLAGYGPLTPEQESTLDRLVAALRAMLQSRG